MQSLFLVVHELEPFKRGVYFVLDFVMPNYRILAILLG